MAKQNQPLPSSPSSQLPIVLISGIGGAMGSILAEALAGQYRIIGIDRDCSENLPIDCIPVDLTSDEAVIQVFHEIKKNYGKHITSVIHLAGYYDFSGEESPLYEQVNEQGTRRLLKALQGFQVEQFIYSSTMLVHQFTEPGIAINEESPLQARWAYPISKLKTEQIIEAEHGNIPYVLLRIAGLYDDRGGPPTLTQQIKRIYERSFKSHFFAGDTSHGQTFIHIDDLVKAFVRVIERRDCLPKDAKILIGEPAAMSYQGLQNELGQLIHGESWKTFSMPKPLAKTETWVEQKVDAAVATVIDDSNPPFIRPFMIDRADDHYELDISQARRLLDWQPEHLLRDTLSTIVAALKDDPLSWYHENDLIPAPWLIEAAAETPSAERLRVEHERWYRHEHRRTQWAHFINMFLGAWLITSPTTLGYQSTALSWSDTVSGILVLLFAALSLSWQMPWARWVTAGIGFWLLCAPLFFWAPLAAGYLNDTLVGALVIGFAVLVRPTPGVSRMATMTGPDIPPDWDYNPSSWTQRLLIIILAVIGLLISRYLAAYQLGHIDSVWEPFFMGGPDPKNGTEEIITSKVSEAWPVPDAGLGALTYLLEILIGIVGSQQRWRTMPWVVLIFGIMIVPLGAVSIFFIIIQPILLGTWCTLCLIGAAAMLVQIPYSLDEILATCQFLWQRSRQGRPLLRIFIKGDTLPGGGTVSKAQEFERSPWTVVKDMFGGGVNLPWTLVVSVAIGVWLMFTRLSLDTSGAMANSDHLIGALVITVSVTALAEVGRPLRFINVLLGISLLATPWIFAGGTTLADWLSVVLGLLLILLSIPRGSVKYRFGSWNRYIV